MSIDDSIGYQQHEECNTLYSPALRVHPSQPTRSLPIRLLLHPKERVGAVPSHEGALGRVGALHGGRPRGVQGCWAFCVGTLLQQCWWYVGYISIYLIGTWNKKKKSSSKDPFCGRTTSINLIILIIISIMSTRLYSKLYDIFNQIIRLLTWTSNSRSINTSWRGRCTPQSRTWTHNSTPKTNSTPRRSYYACILHSTVDESTWAVASTSSDSCMPSMPRPWTN